MKNAFFLPSLALLAASLAIALGISARGTPSVRQTNLERLPLQIAGWSGRSDAFSPGVYEILNADLHVYRHYRSPEGREVSMYLGYYGTAKGGRTGHNPYACLPGAGWSIVETGNAVVRTSYRPEGARINYLVSTKDGKYNVMAHWYQSAGRRILSTGIEQNIERFRGRILSNRNDGAYVQVNALASDRNLPETRETVLRFAGELAELLPSYWPVER